MSNQNFPFTAVVGQENLKKALILACINPRVGGVLAVGSKGCGKSTVVRALSDITSMEIVELPLNCTLDRMKESMDIAKTVQKGKRKYEKGLLERAKGQILYMDEVNLLSDSLVNVLIASHEAGGLAYVMVGTMNPEEGGLRPHFLDRFGLLVQVRGSRTLEERMQIVKSALEYEKDPRAFRNRFKQETEELKAKIEKAKTQLSHILVPEEICRFASELCRTGDCRGHRGDIYLVETAKACAVWEGEDTVTMTHIREAAVYVLPHRLPTKEEKEENLSFSQENRRETADTQEMQAEESAEEKQQENDFQKDLDWLEQWMEEKESSLPEELFQAVSGMKGASLPMLRRDRRFRLGSGKRSSTKTASRGRYIRYAIPRGDCRDLALDATLRAAAPYQKLRQREGVAICVEKSDFREKVRERRIGASILFVVDASRSMEAKRRMAFAKGAVLSILQEAYCKRDQVGMVVFRDSRAELCLNFTRSVELAAKRLDQIPVKGNTPLVLGLTAAYAYIKREMQKNPDLLPVIVLLTDGRANDAPAGDPFEEAIKAAKVIAGETIRAIIIDTETGSFRLGLAQEIAAAMNARCIPLDELMPEEVGKLVHGF